MKEVILLSCFTDENAESWRRKIMDATLPSQDGEHLNTEPVLGVRGCLSPASVSLGYTFPGISSTPTLTPMFSS